MCVHIVPSKKDGTVNTKNKQNNVEYRRMMLLLLALLELMRFKLVPLLNPICLLLGTLCGNMIYRYVYDYRRRWML